MGFLIWLLETIGFFFACIFVMSFVDDKTRNGYSKIPVFIAFAFIIAIFMAFLHYVPYLLFFLLFIQEHFIFKELINGDFERRTNIKINRLLFKSSHYLFFVCILIFSYGLALEIGNNNQYIPVWKYLWELVQQMPFWMQLVKTEPTNWLIFCGIFWVFEHALFGMQRASLLISRNVGIQWEGGGELLLPRWYAITWLVILGKWCVFLAMAIFWTWKVAIGIAIGGFILNMIAPIPYKSYKGIFQRKVNQISLHNPVIGAQLKMMLDDAPF